MSEAVIVDAIRTPIGRAVKGSLRDVRADDLAAIPLRALVERNPGVDFSETDDVMMGCGFPDHEQGYNIGRNAQLLAGIDHHVPAVTVSRFCASSLQTIRMAFHAIKAGEGDQYIAAGVECVSRGAAMTLPVMNPRIDGTNGTGYNVYISMGLTAENVAERCKVSREAQDEWAALSQQRACAARDSGHFDREIVGVEIPAAHDAGGDVVQAHTFLTCRALHSVSSKSSSRMCHTGCQYTPVASIATCVTRYAASQSRSATNPATVVENSASCGSRRSAASGTRTHAVTCALCTSSAPTRS
jgi:acetyl-CoA acetyltransferase